jgi:hypothetical protein
MRVKLAANFFYRGRAFRRNTGEVPFTDFPDDVEPFLPSSAQVEVDGKFVSISAFRKAHPKPEVQPAPASPPADLPAEEDDPQAAFKRQLQAEGKVLGGVDDSGAAHVAQEAAARRDAKRSRKK